VLQGESHAPAHGRGNQGPADHVGQSSQPVSDFPAQKASAAVVKNPEGGLKAQTAAIAAVREFAVLQAPDYDFIGRQLLLTAP
jgi:hypothetical protein